MRQVDTLRPGLLGTHRNEFAARYCGRRLLCSRPGRSGAKHYDNSGVARPAELRGLLMKVLLMTWWSFLSTGRQCYSVTATVLHRSAL